MITSILSQNNRDIYFIFNKLRKTIVFLCLQINLLTYQFQYISFIVQNIFFHMEFFTRTFLSHKFLLLF